MTLHLLFLVMVIHHLFDGTNVIRSVFLEVLEVQLLDYHRSIMY